MRGKFNIFQKTMLQWNEMHPYSAVHIVRIPEPLDLTRLTQLIDRELEELGLTGLVIDKRRGTFEYRGGSLLNPLKVLEGDSHSVLQREIEEQLNAGFLDDGPLHPFRFFVMKEKDAFRLGLVYFHVIAGAESIILLLKRFTSKYLGQDLASLSSPLDLYPRGPGTFLSRHPQYLLKRLSTLPSSLGDLRQSSRPRYQDVRDQTNGVILFSLGPEEFQMLLKTSKRWGVTLNDLFLALMMKSLSSFASRRFSSKRHRKMSVGSIVNIRRDLRIDSLKTFGLFLGSFVISHPVPEGIPVEKLAKDIYHKTLEIKKNKLYLGTPLELWFARGLLFHRSSDGRKSLYAKYYPLWGGITNVNLNTVWEQQEQGGAIDYLRAVSTGPITPIVLSATTVRDKVNMGLTYKKTVFPESTIDAFVADFNKNIQEVGKCHEEASVISDS